MKLLAPEPGWTATADVIVVGSGIAGLTTAHIWSLSFDCYKI